MTDISEARFIPNPERAIWVEGPLRQPLFDRLEPQLVALTSQSHAPITLFIDSEGGSSLVCHRLVELLSPCPTITVARKAKSAAADLLSSGDWAIAEPGINLLYHGTRIPTSQPVTFESAVVMSRSLKKSNGEAFGSLARKSIQRFRFILSALRASVEEYRQNASIPTLEYMECLEVVLFEKLSNNGRDVLRRAFSHWHKCRVLIDAVWAELERAAPVGRTDFERAILNACVAFEWETGPFDANSSPHRIGEYFSYLDACFQNKVVSKDSEFLEWCFFVSLCRALQEGENELTATDALWLGLIDTIEVPCSRNSYRASSEAALGRWSGPLSDGHN